MSIPAEERGRHRARRRRTRGEASRREPPPPWPRRLKLFGEEILVLSSGFRAPDLCLAHASVFVPAVPAFCTLRRLEGPRSSPASAFVAGADSPSALGSQHHCTPIENEEMDRASATMTAALGCSGFVSYDFMLDRETGRARSDRNESGSVSSTHLGAVFGRDICGAFRPNCQAPPLPAAQPVQMTAAVAYSRRMERDRTALICSPAHHPRRAERRSGTGGSLSTAC